jgi:TRAP-type C4-dicarboxylate transport system substrate-binding protein
MDFGSALSRLSAAKAQITIARRKEQEYLEYQRQNNMFFNEAEDETLAKFRRKLQSKIEKYTELEREVILSVKNERLQ